MEFLHPLFPHADLETLHKKVSELLSESIHLVNLMTEEPSIFGTAMMDFGRGFHAPWMEAPEEEVTERGRVVICTFPLFGVWVHDAVGGENVFQVLVKAEVELEKVGE
jgi:hypothetical protein